jgi:hypothetical protein
MYCIANRCGINSERRTIGITSTTQNVPHCKSKSAGRMNDSEKESYIKLGIPTRLQSKHILHNSEMHLLSCPDYDYDFLKMFNV